MFFLFDLCFSFHILYACVIVSFVLVMSKMYSMQSILFVNNLCLKLVRCSSDRRNNSVPQRSKLFHVLAVSKFAWVRTSSQLSCFTARMGAHFPMVNLNNMIRFSNVHGISEGFRVTAAQFHIGSPIVSFNTQQGD